MARVVVRLSLAAAALFGLMLLLGVWLTHSLVHGWVGRTDDSIERQLLSGRTSFWNTVTNAGTQLAQPITVEVALVLLVIGLAVVTRSWIASTFLAVTVGVESGIYFLTSTLDHRPRPSIPRLGIGDPTASYPSGHVAASICLYGGLASPCLGHDRPALAAVAADRVRRPSSRRRSGCAACTGGSTTSAMSWPAPFLGLVWLTVTTRWLLVPALQRRGDDHRVDPAADREAVRTA